MYFSGAIEIDPSQITKIDIVKPTKFFKKIMHTITLGKTGDKVEKETFTAMAVLNQLYNALKDAGINNIIRLSLNNHDFYLDNEGKADDLDEAMFEINTAIDPLESEVFDNVIMVLEHDENNQKYLAEIKITKEHKVGEYPIKVIVNGLISDLKAKPDETKEQLKQRMDKIFQSQNEYNIFVDSHNSMFKTFLDNLALSVKKFLPSDDIKIETNTKIIRPKEKVSDRSVIRKNQHSSSPVYHGYHGYDDFFFYSFLWASALHSHNIYIHNADIVDPEGQDVMSIGEEGFNAGETNTLNEEADFEPPNEGDVDYYGDNEFESEMSDANLFGDDTLKDVGYESDSDSGWLSGSDDGGFDFGDFGDFD
jgi:hypothetical protein